MPHDLKRSIIAWKQIKNLMIKEVMVLGEATNELSNLCVIKGCLLRRDVIALSVVRVPLLASFKRLEEGKK